MAQNPGDVSPSSRHARSLLRKLAISHAIRDTARSVNEKTPLVSDFSTSARKDRGVLALRVIHSPHAPSIGKSIPLVTRITVGRESDEQVNFVVPDAAMSRVHFTIDKKDGMITVVDHDSTNGTQVQRLKRKQGLLSPGNVIRAADTVFFFGVMPSRPAQPTSLIGTSLVMRELIDEATQVAPSLLPVLLLGETGTGKEVIARLIHTLSGRQGPFVAVNCGALPSHLVEAAFFGHKKGAFTGADVAAPGFWLSADGGTLFLDEIGELPAEMQPKLLRVLATGEVMAVGAVNSQRTDVRVIAATNVDLPASVEDGDFRRDLYARIQGLTLQIPPLRERREDVLPLFLHFLGDGNSGYTLTPAFVEALLLYDWPMNVRELEVLTQRLLVMLRGESVLTVDALPDAVKNNIPAQRAQGRKDPSKDDLLSELVIARGNVALVAEKYKRDRRQIYRWLEKYGIDANDFRLGRDNA
jgi:transcriptional regulator with PAS, ATPase and Fis domain